jgi:hypothetical protein
VTSSFIEFVAEANAAPPIDGEPLDYALAHPDLQREGLWLECGVYRGNSLRKIAAARRPPGSGDYYDGPLPRAVGFDSFLGLPQAWRDGHPAGEFSTNGETPNIEGADIVIGLFDESLPPFLARTAGPVTLLHVDCDLYKSTRVVLQHVIPRLARGAFVVFDEALDYPGFERHEILALFEAHRRGFVFEWVARNGEKVALRAV